ncbi:MAG: extracellular solute-binding protein [Spirochaetaceae bacterium]|nr:extracellular solute-binding protein [Spirochaetaceae bacterium]
MKKLFILFLVAFLVSCGGGERLNLYNWSYYIPFETLAQFEREYGVRINLDTYDSNEMMYARIAAGNAGFDIVVPSADFTGIMIRQNMLQPINHEWLPNFNGISPSVIAQMQSFDPGNRFAVPYFQGATGIHVNTNFVPNFEESWSIFNRSDLRNRMTMLNDPRETLGAALLSLGLNVNTTIPSEITAARDVVMGWRQNLLKFDSETFGKDFASRSTWVAHGYAEVVMKEIEGETGIAHTFFIPQEGSVLYLDSLVILRQSQRAELAHQFMNFLLRPDVHAFIADYFFYPAIIPAANNLRTTVPPYTIEEALAKGSQLKLDVGEAITLYNEAWNQILAN